MSKLIDLKKTATGVFAKVSAVSTGALVSLQASAQDAGGGIDTTAVQSAIDAAKSDGLSVGAMVVAAVAAFAVIGVIISVVRKL